MRGLGGAPVRPPSSRRPCVAPSHRPKRIRLTSTAAAILERDQRVGDAGPRVEAPARTARTPRRRSSIALPIRIIPPDETRAIRAICKRSGVRPDAAACTCADRAPAMDLDVEALKAKLTALKIEHRDLDDVIARIAERVPFDQLQLQRLKKRKLLLKDQISKIESELLPDIIA